MYLPHRDVSTQQLGNKDDVSAEDDVILVISPQSIAGYSIHPLLVDTVEHANGRCGSARRVL